MNAGPRVLVIDDDPSIAALIEDVLRDEGYLVRTAGDGRKGLAAVAEYAPELILVDWRMPGMDGGAFLQEYRACEAEPARLIVMSAATDLPVGEELGVDIILTKPFELDDLVETVERMLPDPG